jgi:hypothetical protein
MVRQGFSEREIAKELGIGNVTVHKIKARNGLTNISASKNWAKKRTMDSVGPLNDRLLSFNLKCVVFNGRRERVVVRCLECGCEFERDGSWLYSKQNKSCPKCSEEEREVIRIKREEEEKLQREKLNEERIRQQEERRREKEEEQRKKKKAKMQEVHICGCCGRQYTIEETGYNSAKYCSERCQNRAYRRKHDQVRDHRKRWRKHDSDITLEKLFKRDSGKCYLCGGDCDWSDIRVNENGIHIAGNQYPSIDHVFPLSKGGTDTWDNIKLAHRICNSLKRDSLEEIT